MNFIVSFHLCYVIFVLWAFYSIGSCIYFFQLTLDCIYRWFAENPHTKCSASSTKLNSLLSVSQSSNFPHLDFCVWCLNYGCLDFAYFHEIFWKSFSWMSCFCFWNGMNLLKFLMKALSFNEFPASFGLFAHFLSQHDGSPCTWVDCFHFLS